MIIKLPSCWSYLTKYLNPFVLLLYWQKVSVCVWEREILSISRFSSHRYVVAWTMAQIVFLRSKHGFWWLKGWNSWCLTVKFCIQFTQIHGPTTFSTKFSSLFEVTWKNIWFHFDDFLCFNVNICKNSSSSITHLTSD
jgi:hypothetical protein